MDQNNPGEYRHYIVLTENILGAKDINASDKMLLAYISAFEEYFASNASAAEFLGMSERSIERSKQKLVKLGYVDVIRDTGRGRIYAIRLSRFAKNGGAGSPKMADQMRQNWRTYNKDYIKDYNVDTNVSTGAEAPADEEEKAEEQPATYGRDDINEIVDLWEQETGTSIKGDKYERRQIYNLIRKHGAERTKALVRAVGDIRRNGDRFAPQIATPRELTGKYSKLGRLEMWMERKSISRPFGTQEKPLTPCPDYALPPRDLPEYGGAFEVQSDEEREKVAKMMAEKRKSLPFMKKKEADNE